MTSDLKSYLTWNTQHKLEHLEICIKMANTRLFWICVPFFSYSCSKSDNITHSLYKHTHIWTHKDNTNAHTHIPMHTPTHSHTQNKNVSEHVCENVKWTHKDKTIQMHTHIPMHTHTDLHTHTHKIKTYVCHNPVLNRQTIDRWKPRQTIEKTWERAMTNILNWTQYTHILTHDYTIYKHKVYTHTQKYWQTIDKWKSRQIIEKNNMRTSHDKYP